MRSLLVPSLFSLISLTHSYSDLSPSHHGSCPAPSTVEVWESAVTVTEWTTHTAHAPCPDCESAATDGGAAYSTSKHIPPPVSTPATALWSNPAAPTSTQTLYPTPHWEHDASDPEVLVPGHDTKTYYGPSDEAGAGTAHSFQWINATLTSPAVVLDHSDLLTYTWSNASQTLTIKFASDEAFDLAQSTWNTSMILVAYTEGCGNYEGGDKCYIAVKSLTFDETTQSCAAVGVVQTLKDCLHSMEASWGQYIPAKGAPSSSSFDHEAFTSSVFSSVLSKYPKYSSELSSYMSGSKYGGAHATGASSSANAPAGTVTTGSRAGYPGTKSSSIPASTSGGMQYGGYQSGYYPTVGTGSGYSTTTITAPPSTSTSLSPSVSRISSSLSSYLSSISASYASYSLNSKSASSGDSSSTSLSSTGSVTGTGSITSMSTSETSTNSVTTSDTSSTTSTGSDSSSGISTDTSTTSDVSSTSITTGSTSSTTSASSGGTSTTSSDSSTITSTSTGTITTSVTSGSTTLSTSGDSSTTTTTTTINSGSSTSSTSESGSSSSSTSGSTSTTPSALTSTSTSTDSSSTSTDSTSSSTSSTSSTTSTESTTSSTTGSTASSDSSTTTTTESETSTSSTTTASSTPAPTCLSSLPPMCNALRFYTGDDLFSPTLDCSTWLYGLSQTGEISADSLQPAYSCLAHIDSTTAGLTVANCVDAAIVCGSTKTTTSEPATTDSTTSTSTESSTVPVPTCVPGVDPTYGLPTYCVGSGFDSYLDSIDGIVSLSQTDFAKLTQLFPNVFSSLTRRFHENRVQKRCGWDDWGGCVDKGTDAAKDGLGHVTSIFSSVGNDVASSLSSALQVVTSVAHNIQDAAAARGQELSDGAARAIAELQNGLAQALSYDKSGHIDVNITPPDSAKVESPWGSQVLIKSLGRGGKQSEEEGAKTLAERGTDFSLNIFCVDCYIRGSVDLHGKLSIDSDGIHELSISTDVSQMDVNLGVGLNAKAEWSHTFRINLFQQGIPNLCSGTTLCIGPYVKMDAELTVGVESEGYLLAGGKWTFTDAHCELNAYEGGQSQRNWSPAFESNINAGGEVTLSATVGVPLTVGVGVTILNGAISKDISLEVKPTVTGKAQAAIEVSHDETGTDVDGHFGDCDGIYVSSFWQVVLSYNILDLKGDDLYDTGEQPIADKCIPWDAFLPGEDKANGNTNTGFGEGSGTGSSYATSVYLVDRFDSAPLQICNDGNVYRVAGGVNIPGCSANWLAYASTETVNAAFSAAYNAWLNSILSPSFSDRLDFPDLNAIAIESASVIASGARRIPILFPETIDKVSVSRFRIVDTGAIPAKGEYVAFDYVDQAHGRVAHDLAGNKYSAVQCLNVISENFGFMNQVFFVPYMAPGLGLSMLNSGGLANSITNGPVADCRVMALDMVRH